MTTPCRHHWVIESPNGPTSHGRCRRCKAKRDFTNWSPKFDNRLSLGERMAVRRAKREDAIMGGLIRTLDQGAIE